MPAVAGVVPLWRNRDYLVLWSGQAVSSFGTQMSLLAFPLLMLALTHSPVAAGLLGAARALPYMVLSLPAGALVDRWNRKRVMLVSDSGRALAMGSIPLALWLGHLTMIQLFVVTLIEGTLFSFYSMAESACLPRVLAKEQIHDAVAQSQTTDSLAFMAGPALGGVLYGLGRTIPFAVDAVSYAASICSLLLIKTEFQEERQPCAPNLRAEIVEGMIWLWHQPVIRLLALLTGGLNTCCFGYGLIVIVQAQHMHAPSAAIGLILGAGGIGSLVGSLLAAPIGRRYSFGQVIVVASWIWALTWLVYAVAPNPGVLGLGNTITFVIVPIFTVTQYSFRLVRTPDALQGRANSVFRLLAYGGQPFSLALTGALLQAFGAVPTVLILFVPQVSLAALASLSPVLRHASADAAA